MASQYIAAPSHPTTRQPHIEPLESRIVLAVPAGFADLPVASGLDHPVAMDFAPDGRIFVTQQNGDLRVIKDGALLAAPFAHFDVATSGERGLLGVTFDPDFSNNGYVYVYETVTTPTTHNRISRITAAGDVAVAGSRVTIRDFPEVDAAVHNGGALHFGLDGKLYVALGENGRATLAQSLASPFGKILRMNADGSVPADNPFVGTSGADTSVWAMGLRNPFTFDIHRTTGQMFINDVGQATWEEIDQGAAGANFGWPAQEGPSTDPAYAPPLYTYNHNTGNPTGCAITGGTYYDAIDSSFPAEFDGDYFFSDGCNQWIWRRDATTGAISEFATDIGPAFGLSTGPDGSLYYLVYNSGLVRKISFVNDESAPVFVSQPANQSVAIGQSVTFSGEAFGKAPVEYQWQRDGVDISGATSASLTLDAVTAADKGASFRLVATNALGSETSAVATLDVLSDAAPTVMITSPKEGRLYKGGQSISFSGKALDAEDGKLNKRSLTWEVVFHHDDHTHPFMMPTAGIASGKFVIPRTGETATDVWFRIHLTATDSNGVISTTFRDVHPRVVTVTIQPSHPALQASLDGQAMQAPFTFMAVAGMRRELSAAATQTLDGVTYTFKKWSKGRGMDIDIVIPDKDKSFRLIYQPA